MLKSKFFRPMLVALLLTTGGLGATQAIAFTTIQESHHPSTWNQNSTPLMARLPFRLRVRASRWRVPGLRRGGCSGDTTENAAELHHELMPVVPPLDDQQGGSAPVDLTVSAHPTILVRVPHLPNTTAYFGLQNEDGTEELYLTEVELTNEQAGIMGFQIPSTVPPLEVGQKYMWQVALVSTCREGSGEIQLITNGWLERIEPTGTLALVEQVPLRDRPTLYAEAGIWQEMVSSLAKLRLQNPNDSDLAETWASLMESVGLENLANEPILQVYRPEAEEVQD